MASGTTVFSKFVEYDRSNIYGNNAVPYAAEEANNISEYAGNCVPCALKYASEEANNGAESGAVSIINGFIAAINVAISIINAIPGVSINSISPLEVPALATPARTKSADSAGYIPPSFD